MEKTIIFILTLIAFSANAQTLSLAELQTLCKLSNWETGANTLTRKGWEYHDSKRGDTFEYSTITYAHSKDDWFEDRAAAWFYFYTYDNHVERISYQPTDNAFKAIKASLSANGYKQTDSEIHDNYITSTYTSPSFILEINTTTQERAYGGGKKVSYLLTLTRKGGIYDDDNGEKVVYYYGTSNIKERYTLKDGKRNGKAYTYYSDGTPQSTFTYVNGTLTGEFVGYYENGEKSITGTVLNGKKNGLVTEYDNTGNKKSEQYYKDGEYDGKYTAFDENGKVTQTCNFTNGKKNGPFVEYFYKSNGEVYLQNGGNYLNDQKDGLWANKALVDGDWKTITYSNYSNGELNGKAREWDNGDTIVFCEYLDGQRHGKYQEKGRLLGLGSSLLDDEQQMFTFVEGNYSYGKKTGYWTYRNRLGFKTDEGTYVNSKKNGVWKHYAPYSEEQLDEDGNHDGQKYFFQLMLIENYANDERNGQVIKFKSKTFLPFNDSIDYICNYRWDKPHGHFEQHDNNGNIITEGYFENGNRHGRWTIVDTSEDAKYCDNYNNGKLDGLCEEFFYSTGKKKYSNNYKNGVLDGQQIWFSPDGHKFVESNFNDGIMISQIYYKDGQKIGEFSLMYKESKSFSGRITSYFTGNDNPEISKTITENTFNIHPDSVLTNPFYLVQLIIEKQLQGKTQTFDHQNRIIIDGQYRNNKPSGLWLYRYYDQNVYFTTDKDFDNIPWKFNTIDLDQPYTGKFTRTEHKDGKELNATYKIKKSLIEEISYTDPQTGKTVMKQKYENGLPKLK